MSLSRRCTGRSSCRRRGRWELEIVRVDEVAGPGIIFEDIKREITQASVVIAEVTAPNQNVFYELGYSHHRVT